MPLESASYPTDFVTSNPAASDGMNNADDHMRLIKDVMKRALAGVNSALTRVIGTTFGVLAGDGNITTPGYGFTSEPTLGFYRSAAGEISLSGGGVLRGNGTIPAGFICDFASATAPTGWAPCDGQSVAVAAQPALFAAIAYTWGGSGANFNVPYLVAKYRRHRDDGAVSGAVGNTQASQMPAHTHTGGVSTTGTAAAAGAHGHTLALNDPGHSHFLNAITDTATSGSSGPLAVPRLNVGTNNSVTTATAFTSMSGSANAVGDHTHTVSTSGSFTTDVSGAGTETRPVSATVLTCIKL